jgi:DNA-binding transcriptional LysR family regulator
MNFNLLKSFVVLADRLHFGEAAFALNLSQSALTKQIQRLEDDLGGPLFERGRQGTELTALGRFLRRDAEALLDQADQLRHQCRRAALGEIGRLDVGFSFSTVDIISTLVGDFRRRHPEVEIALHDLSSSAQMDLLGQGRLNLGFVRLPARAGLSHLQVTSDRLALVVPAVRAAQIPRFDVSQLRDRPFIGLLRDRAPGLHDHIVRFCAARGFTPRLAQYANESLIMLSMVAADVGVAIMPFSTLQRPLEGVVVREIEDADAGWDVGLAWTAGTSDPLTHKFIELTSLTRHRPRQKPALIVTDAANPAPI